MTSSVYGGRLVGIAYRMTGAATDADEILQDAWLRRQDADRTSVGDPAAYLAKKEGMDTT